MSFNHDKVTRSCFSVQFYIRLEWVAMTRTIVVALQQWAACVPLINQHRQRGVEVAAHCIKTITARLRSGPNKHHFWAATTPIVLIRGSRQEIGVSSGVHLAKLQPQWCLTEAVPGRGGGGIDVNNGGHRGSRDEVIRWGLWCQDSGWRWRNDCRRRRRIPIRRLRRGLRLNAGWWSGRRLRVNSWPRAF